MFLPAKRLRQNSQQCIIPMKTMIINILGVKRNCCVEIMGQMIRQNKNIIGIRIGKEREHRLHYANDIVLFVDGSGKRLKYARDLLFPFSKIFKLNIWKTKAIWIGSKAQSSDKLSNDSGILWTTEPFNILGV